MRTLLRTVSVFALGVIVGALTIPALSAQFRVNNGTTLMKTDLSGFCEGKEVVVTLNEYSPGTSAPHYHPGYSFGYVIEGSQVSTQDGMPPVTIHTGEILFEEPMRVNVSRNSAPAKVVTFRILEKGKPANVPAP